MHSLSEEELDQLYDMVESWPEVAKVYRHPLRPCVQFWPLWVEGNPYGSRVLFVQPYQIDWEGFPDTGTVHYSRCLSYQYKQSHLKVAGVDNFYPQSIKGALDEAEEMGFDKAQAIKQRGRLAVCYGNVSFDPNDPVGFMLKLRAFATADTMTSDKIQGLPRPRLSIECPVMVNRIRYLKNGVKTVPVTEVPKHIQYLVKQMVAGNQVQV